MSIKYNDKNNIKIDISLSKFNERVKLSIKDNGMGIPNEDINSVMKRFYKVDKSRVSNNSFGLGLSIESRIIKKYSGKINIYSQLGEYTEVDIII